MKPVLLNVHRLTGGYNVRRPVLHEVSFRVATGEMVGLIGLNGAGKSTVIKHILRLMTPISGNVTIKPNHRVHKADDERKFIGYLPETPLLYDELTLWEHLEFTSVAYQLDQATFQRRADHLLQQFGMEKMIHAFPSEFSKGMKQKVMVMCALLVEPALLIVDEPFTGLDPLATRTLLKRLTEHKKRGAGILMSTHMLATAESTCDRFIFLHQGRIILKGTLSEMRKETGLPYATLEQLFFHAIRGNEQ